MLNIGKETYCMFGTSMGVEGHLDLGLILLSLVMDLLGIPEPYLSFIKLHAKLKSSLQKNSPSSHIRCVKQPLNILDIFIIIGLGRAKIKRIRVVRDICWSLLSIQLA